MASSPATVVRRYLAAVRPDLPTLAGPVFKATTHVEKLNEDMEPVFRPLNRAWASFHSGRDQGQWAEINQKALPKTKWAFEEVQEAIKQTLPKAEKLLGAIKSSKQDQGAPDAYKKARSIATWLKKPVGDVTSKHPGAEAEGYASACRALSQHFMELGRALREVLQAPDKAKQEAEAAAEKARQDAERAKQEAEEQKAIERAEKARQEAKEKAEKAEKARQDAEKARQDAEKARQDERSTGGWLPQFARAFTRLRQYLEQTKDTEGLALLNALGEKAEDVENFGGARLSIMMDRLGDYLKEKGDKQAISLDYYLGVAFDEQVDEQSRIREERAAWGDEDDE